MFGEKNVPVDMGIIPLGVLNDWASGSARFQEVTSDESRLQEAFVAAQKQMREIGVPEEYIKQINREIFDESMREILLVAYVRASVEGYFQRKTETETEIENETLGNSVWLSETVEKTIESIVESALNAAISCDAIELLNALFGVDEDEDENDDDQDDDCE